MDFKVSIYDQNDSIISEDVWSGSSKKNVSFWVDLAISDIINKTSYRKLNFKIENILEEEKNIYNEDVWFVKENGGIFI